MNKHPVAQSQHEIKISIGDKVFVKQMQLTDRRAELAEKEGIITHFTADSFTVQCEGEPPRVFPFGIIREGFVALTSSEPPDPAKVLQAKKDELRSMYDLFKKHGLMFCRDGVDVEKMKRLMHDLQDAMLWMSELSGGEKS